MANTVRWRGIDVDPDTAKMLDAIARDCGDDIRPEGIPGYGSYRQNAASGGTDAGGGHADINLVGYNPEQCRRLETVARSKGAAAYWRPARRPDGSRYGWQEHLHILRMDCPDLSDAAKIQVSDYIAGYDGLYYGYDSRGNRIRKKDSGSRSYTSRRWLTLSASLGGPVPAPKLSIPKEEDIMASIADLDASVERIVRKLIPEIAHEVVWGGNVEAPQSVKVRYPDAPKWGLGSFAAYGFATAEQARDAAVAAADPSKIAAAIVAALPATREQVTQETVEAALRSVLGSLDAPASGQ